MGEESRNGASSRDSEVSGPRWASHWVARGLAAAPWPVRPGPLGATGFTRTMRTFIRIYLSTLCVGYGYRSTGPFYAARASDVQLAGLGSEVGRLMLISGCPTSRCTIRPLFAITCSRIQQSPSCTLFNCSLLYDLLSDSGLQAVRSRIPPVTCFERKDSQIRLGAEDEDDGCIIFPAIPRRHKQSFGKKCGEAVGVIGVSPRASLWITATVSTAVVFPGRNSDSLGC